VRTLREDRGEYHGKHPVLLQNIVYLFTDGFVISLAMAPPGAREPGEPKPHRGDTTGRDRNYATAAW